MQLWKFSLKSEENIHFQKRKIIREIFVVITIFFTTLVKEFELMKYFQKRQ